MAMVDADLDAKSCLSSSESHCADAKVVNFLEKLILKPGKLIDLVYIIQFSHELLFGKPCHLILGSSYAYTHYIRRASPALSLLNRIKHARSYTVEIAMCAKLFKGQLVCLAHIFTPPLSMRSMINEPLGVSSK